MSIQYANQVGTPAGAIVNATLTQSAGTRAELAQWVRDQLVQAGWTSSGSATDYQLTSATTPQSLACRVRVYDPGAGNCARLKLSNTGGTKTQAGDSFLLPAASKVWRIIANKYQFFVMTPGASAAREFACGGSPYLPSFLGGVITECFWGWNNTNSDAGSLATSFRTRLSTSSVTSPLPNWIGVVNGSVFEWNGTATNPGIGGPALELCYSSRLDLSSTRNPRWHDDSLPDVEPLLSWGLTGPGDIAKIRGQLWDSVVITDSFAADTQIALDGRTYWAITNSNSGLAGIDAPGTLFVAVT